jgi:Pyruvate/2-oxoacid:ferredoxin oxidoreductase delta subunit
MGVFLIRFGSASLSTLYATQLLWTGGTEHWASFSPFSTQNLKCQSTWMFCPSTSWTTSIKIDF